MRDLPLRRGGLFSFVVCVSGTIVHYYYLISYAASFAHDKVNQVLCPIIYVTLLLIS